MTRSQEPIETLAATQVCLQQFSVECTLTSTRALTQPGAAKPGGQWLPGCVCTGLYCHIDCSKMCHSRGLGMCHSRVSGFSSVPQQEHEFRAKCASPRRIIATRPKSGFTSGGGVSRALSCSSLKASTRALALVDRAWGGANRIVTAHAGGSRGMGGGIL